ncbi:acyl-CoA dehydrogenase [Actinomycetospora lutea]|uniref:acyl-CoA dehydrogenase n=1 Tax=Actinomycetospora lutea TaxID=663604 RepID=UPI00236716A4|nr:acyl-CoA dehydrogenase [Actinomycetospora lutea]MDD7941396.1 acyl-CoA dehydrogenase [Actinomycetospora lutea]
MPRELDGMELAPREVIAAIEALSRADASTGWVVMTLQMAIGTTAAYLGREPFAEITAEHGDRTLAAGQGTRPGRARAAAGGYLLSGSWSFASGLHHATHIHTAALCDTGEVRVFTLPRELVTIVDDWDVMGLRATGSVDYHCEDVFVPAEHTYVATTTEPLLGGGVFRLGLAAFASLQHVGWALGVGRRLLDEMQAVAAAKAGTRNAGVDTSEFHADYARAEATLRAARAWNLEVWADIEAGLERGEGLTTEQDTLLRLALHTATQAAQEVGRTVYQWAGTTALRSGPLNRVFRDLHGGTQHVTSGPAVRHGCGRHLAGLAPGASWVFLDLVEPAA